MLLLLSRVILFWDCFNNNITLLSLVILSYIYIHMYIHINISWECNKMHIKLIKINQYLNITQSHQTSKTKIYFLCFLLLTCNTILLHTCIYMYMYICIYHTYTIIILYTCIKINQLESINTSTHPDHFKSISIYICIFIYIFFLYQFPTSILL